MSPEQFTSFGDCLFPRAPDIYALGVILYELLTGRRPFDFTAMMCPAIGKPSA